MPTYQEEVADVFATASAALRVAERKANEHVGDLVSYQKRILELNRLLADKEDEVMRLRESNRILLQRST